MQVDPVISLLSDRAVFIDLPKQANCARLPLALCAFLREHAALKAHLLGMPKHEWVPGDHNVTLVFECSPTPLSAMLLLPDLIGEAIENQSGNWVDWQPKESTLHTVPVQYGGDHGPDLLPLAEHLGLHTHEVIALHTTPIYTVQFLGFLPGFAYLAGVSAQLHVERLSSPRPAVPAGSVGLAAGYTAIYPWRSPGGWHILGQTARVFFDAAQPDGRVSVLQPGDRVQFVDARHV